MEVNKKNDAAQRFCRVVGVELVTFLGCFFAYGHFYPVVSSLNTALLVCLKVRKKIIHWTSS